MIGVSIARNTRSGSAVGPGIAGNGGLRGAGVLRHSKSLCTFGSEDIGGRVATVSYVCRHEGRMRSQSPPSPLPTAPDCSWKSEVKKELALVRGNIPVVKAPRSGDRGEGSTEDEMMVRVIMFSAIVLAAARVPAAAETGDDGGDWSLDKVPIHAGHGHGAMERKQRPKVCTRNGLRASCQA
jgi:hypothetical protein